MFWRLTTVADDFGRFNALPMVLQATCFTSMLNAVSQDDTARWMQELHSAGLAEVYEVDGKIFGHFVNWSKYQRVRNQISKFPPPPPRVIGGNPPQLAAIRRNSPQIAASPVVTVSTVVPVTPVSRSNYTVGSDPTAGGILDWLNTKASRNFRHKAANLDPIRARLKDGIEDWQLRAIVSRKVREWGGTEQAKYLRPATLFNRTKCEQYLGELPPKEQGRERG